MSDPNAGVLIQNPPIVYGPHHGDIQPWGFPLEGVVTLQRDNIAFTLPVNPPSLEIKRSRNYHEIDIVGFRTIGRIGNRQLASIDIAETFFPETFDPSFCNYPSLLNPESSVGLLASWCEQQPSGPVFVTISGSSFASWMVITNFTSEERNAEPGDRYYTLSLKTWVDTTVTLVGDASQRPPGPTSPSASGTTTQSYVIQPGDSLWGIAKKFYGDGSLWPTIYNANINVIGTNPNLIVAGQVLVIPPHP